MVALGAEMSTDEPDVTQAAGASTDSVLARLKWVFWLGALVVGVGAGVGIAIVSRSDRSAPAVAVSAPIQTWPAGARSAPAFNLRNQSGQPLSLASLRGRPVLVAFIDPLCRNFCPREASVLSAAAAQLAGESPAIVAVSVDPWADSAANFHQDALHWKLAPGWQWGTGSHAALAAVWKRYGVGVLVTRKTIAGVSVRYITHTGAAYLIDATGHERALFLYPFTTSDVVGAAKSMLNGS